MYRKVLHISGAFFKVLPPNCFCGGRPRPGMEPLPFEYPLPVILLCAEVFIEVFVEVAVAELICEHNEDALSAKIYM